MSTEEDVIIVGAGPCGLSAAIELKQAGFNPLLIEKGSIVHSIYRYPTYMIFHSTPEKLEIGDIPFTTPNEKPTRQEALNYYRMAAERHQLRIRNYETVTRIEKLEERFVVDIERRDGLKTQVEAASIIIATGYFDKPNLLRIPGEDLEKVYSYYKEAHPFAGMKITIVGGNNSAIDAALDLQRHGAEVTVIYRRQELSPKVKAWTRPLFEGMVQKGHIQMHFNSSLVAIQPHSVIVEHHDTGRTVELPNDFVFTLIGYRPDRHLLQSLGVAFDEKTGVPYHDPETMQTNIDGVYLAGVIAAGNEANEIFIENGRFHGELIAKTISAAKS